MNTCPDRGKRFPAAICALANAAPNDVPMPMTSPVDFISGPSNVSTPGNFENGKTASLTEMCFGMTSSVKPSDANDCPTITRAAILASGWPMALLTKGMVREARGFTSRMNTSSFFTANCTFIKPTTPSSRASAFACRRTSSSTASDSDSVGNEQALSPECTPARSMCSMMPPMTTSLPSLTASTSSSIASSRNLSTRMVRSGAASRARCM